MKNLNKDTAINININIEIISFCISFISFL